MPERYPHIIKSDPTKTAAVALQKNRIKYPAINHSRDSADENPNPFLSYTFPHSAVTTDANTMAGAMTST